MAALWEWYQALSSEKRMGLALGVSVILLCAALAVYWVARDEYDVLFSAMAPEDASAVTSQLDAMKIPSQVDEIGNVLVPKEMVHRARIGVMSEVAELKGPVGYEIFDKSDFGVTELTQRINFQRALEGELARSIAALSEVKKARVHLGVPQHSLFRQDDQKPTASVIVFLKSGESLGRKQVGGIQRLVASAVAQLEPSSVTVLDQSGAMLAGTERDGTFGERTNFGEKEAIEAYLARKAETVIRAAQPDATVAVSVDATINLDRIKTVRETVGKGESSAVLRRRETVADGDTKKGTNTIETEYVVSKQMEEVMSSPGVIERLSVAVTVVGGKGYDEKRLRELVAGAIGLDDGRGDQVALYARTGVTGEETDSLAPAAKVGKEGQLSALLGMLLAVAVGALMILVLRLKRAQRSVRATTMSAAEREQALKRITAWMAADVAVGKEHG